MRLEEDAAAPPAPASSVDTGAMTLTELADHIEQTHHVYLRDELPRLAAMTEEIESVHASRDYRLHQVHETFRAMASELWSHMMKEEMCLFPMIRQLEASEQRPGLHVGSIADPIRQMESEHDDADVALRKLRELTDGFVPPHWACATYRAMLDALVRLEQDMRVHVHKENDVLFPRALELEAAKRHGAFVS
jgi:regulator of cell morphogenesis and NO signaling